MTYEEQLRILVLRLKPLKEGRQDMGLKEDTVTIPWYNVLVVDDEEGVRKLVVTLLSKKGHQCLQAVDGVEALKKARTNKIDAVITDVAIPKMDGVSLTKELSKRTPKLPIMVITAYANEFSSVTAIKAGAREFIKRPFSNTEFSLRFQKMMSDYELSLEIETKQNEMLYHIQKRSLEEISDLKKEIKSLRNRLPAGPRFNQ
jgi:DNA-binding response OmpR family regulator